MNNDIQSKELLATHTQVVNMLNQLEPYSKEGTLPILIVDNYGNMSKIIDTHVFGQDPNCPLYMAIRTESLDLQLPIENSEEILIPVEKFILKATGMDAKKVRWLTHLMRAEGFFILDQQVILNTKNEQDRIKEENGKIPLLQSKIVELDEYVDSLNSQVMAQQEHIDNLLEVLSNENK